MVKLLIPEQLREISASYDRIDQLVEPALAEPSVTYPRSGGRRPEPKDSGPSAPSRLRGPMALRVARA